MQFTSILLTIASISGLAIAAPQDIIARQSGMERVNSILRDARTGAMEQIEVGGGRGRKLTSTPCSVSCSQCQTGAVTTAVADIALCGVAALATEVLTAGAATILEVTGFVACEARVIGELNKGEAECASLP
ncbi:hypothetical protein KVR01_002891 [Diaporthe batatas]|uniref:uncharacterized protein n=1 Tax=Diaporthe batatas TaxID=748121 RepID=UPI001D0591E9|nr:uncharacterized protein KVR01_002891 [Diaporthe batatas]KAG8167202.1 hypothetical protein KVR01_002891 [Diaporthe batatas]